jgi:hypothetical protein
VKRTANWSELQSKEQSKVKRTATQGVAHARRCQAKPAEQCSTALRNATQRNATKADRSNQRSAIANACTVFL